MKELQHRITISEDHILLLQEMYFGLEDYKDTIRVSPKRPYGNSDEIEDLREILGEDLDENYLMQRYRETLFVLQIAIQTQSWDLVGKTFENYEKYGKPKWVLVSESSPVRSSCSCACGRKGSVTKTNPAALSGFEELPDGITYEELEREPFKVEDE